MTARPSLLIIQGLPGPSYTSITESQDLRVYTNFMVTKLRLLLFLYNYQEVLTSVSFIDKNSNSTKLKNLEIGNVLKQIDTTLTNSTVVFIFQYCYISFNFKRENCHNSLQIGLNSTFLPG